MLIIIVLWHMLCQALCMHMVGQQEYSSSIKLNSPFPDCWWSRTGPIWCPATDIFLVFSSDCFRQVIRYANCVHLGVIWLDTTLVQWIRWYRETLSKHLIHGAVLYFSISHLMYLSYHGGLLVISQEILFVNPFSTGIDFQNQSLHCKN